MTFVQGPEIWLNELGISVACVVDPAQNAVLDEAHRVFVNYETYYLSSVAARQTFRQSPWQYTGLVTDPVSRDRFQPDGESPTAAYEGRLFYFVSDAHRETFRQDPEEYAVPVVPYSGRM